MEKGFKSLIVWRKSYDFVLAIYKITQVFPKFEFYRLTSQLIRSAISIQANIAEGHERMHVKEYNQFLNIAKGSAAEAETYLMLAKDLEYISYKDFVFFMEKLNEIERMLNGLIKSILNRYKGTAL